MFAQTMRNPVADRLRLPITNIRVNFITMQFFPKFFTACPFRPVHAACRLAAGRGCGGARRGGMRYGTDTDVPAPHGELYSAYGFTLSIWSRHGRSPDGFGAAFGAAFGATHALQSLNPMTTISSALFFLTTVVWLSLIHI